MSPRATRLDVMRPTGLFVLRDTDVPIVAFAGGSGITPVISIIKSALATTQRPIVLVYANRDAGAVIFADELARLTAGAAGRLSVHHHLDTERGYLDAAACTALVGDRDHADFYVCGPGAYMEVVEEALSFVDVAPEQVFIERFVVPEAAPVDAPTPTESLTITLERRTQTIAVPTGRHDPRGGSARRAEAAVLVRDGQLRDVHGASRRRIGDDARQQRIDGRRGRRPGWVLTCQALPTSREVVVNYDA